jgi:hypothetical protein
VGAQKQRNKFPNTRVFSRDAARRGAHALRGEFARDGRCARPRDARGRVELFIYRRLPRAVPSRVCFLARERCGSFVAASCAQNAYLCDRIRATASVSHSLLLR